MKILLPYQQNINLSIMCANYENLKIKYHIFHLWRVLSNITLISIYNFINFQALHLNHFVYQQLFEKTIFQYGRFEVLLWTLFYYLKVIKLFSDKVFSFYLTFEMFWKVTSRKKGISSVTYWCWIKSSISSILCDKILRHFAESCAAPKKVIFISIFIQMLQKNYQTF